MSALTRPILFAFRLAALAMGLLAGGVTEASVSPPPTVWPPGNALEGKTIYPGACLACHSGTSNATDRLGKVGNGANNPGLINLAILNGTMTNSVLRALTAQQIADIAAYLGNPNVVPGAAIARVAPTSIAFAATAVGTTSMSKTVTLSNAGNAPLGPIGFSASGSFSVLPGSCKAGASVAAGASCTVTVRFKPVGVGAATGKLTFTHNATPTTTAVTLTGTGVAAAAPIASVTPTALTLSQVVGSTSAEQTVTVANTGNAPLLLSAVTIGGAQASEFAKVATSTCGSSVAAGASCALHIAFTPAATGVRKGTLSIAHNAPGSPSVVALNGTGTASPQPILSVNKNALSFSALPLGSSATQSLVVTNSGNATLVLASAKLSGANATDFALGGSCVAGQSLAVAQTCTISVRFTAGVIGTRTAGLDIVSDAPAAKVGLSGVVVPVAAPAVALTPASLDFGTATVGAAALERTVSLTNNGSAPLVLNGSTVTGNGFASTDTCGASLATGASCSFAIAFAPTGAGAHTGTLAVSSNAPGSPHKVALSGSGVLAPLAVLGWTPAAPSAVFADTGVGFTSAPVTLTLLNEGPGSATLDAISTGSGEFGLAGSCGVGKSLAPQASCTVTIAFAPAQVGPRTAKLLVSSSGTDPTPVALEGLGVLAGQAKLTLSPGALRLANGESGGAPVAGKAMLENTGTTDLAVTALRVNAGRFTVTHACGSLPISLAPGQGCELEVALAAGVAGGDVEDVLVVATDAEGVAPTMKIEAEAPEAQATDVSASQIPGSGGCSLVRPDAGLFDPTLWLLCVAAVLVLRARRPRDEFVPPSTPTEKEFDR